jgi:hypothetical protein
MEQLCPLFPAYRVETTSEAMQVSMKTCQDPFLVLYRVFVGIHLRK